MIYRFATAADLIQFFGSLPSQTTKAFVVLEEGQVVVIVGIAREGRINKFFGEWRHREQLKRMTVLRAIKAAMGLVARSKLPVISLALPGEPEAPRLLERLGFHFVESSSEGDVYQWHS